MEKVSTLNKMEQYDFSTPINVTMIFEESEDESLFKNVLKEKIINDDIKQDETGKINSNPNTTSTVQSVIGKLRKDNVMVHIPASCQDISLQAIENKLTDNSSPIYEDSSASKTIKVNQNHLIQTNCSPETTKNICYTIYEKHQRADDIETQDENNKKLLDIVSENVIFVMRLYYHYYDQKCNKGPAMVADLRKQFDKLKAHFFDLSYSTVVSLILPQENNEIFIEKLFNKTVADANKVLQGKWERKHVEPIYNEMFIWVKKKREHIKSLGQKCSSEKKHFESKKNENRILKERLNDPLPAFYVPNLTNVSKRLDISAGPPAPASISNTCDRVMTPENSMCIFSAGDPEREISININPNLLQNQIIQQGLTETQVNFNNDVYSTNSPLNQRQIHYNQYVNQVQQNGYHQRNTIYRNSVRPRPPPYYAKSPQPHNTSSVTLPIVRNIAQTIQNYQIQQNSNSSASSVCSNPNLGQTYNRRFEENSTTPIITNVTSLNPHSWMTYPMIGRCCICGKNTTSRCSKCNNYSYCSTLCQINECIKKELLVPKLFIKETMGEVNILQHMGQFDFSAPISVTIIIEENNDEFPNSNRLKQQDQNQNYTCCSFVENIEKTNQWQQEKIINTNCNKTSPGEQLKDHTTIVQRVINIEDDSISAEPSTRVTKSPSSTIAEQNPSKNKKNTRKQNTYNVLTENNITDVSKIYSSTNDRQGWAMYVINLLHRVSADLILVMRPYYYDSFRNHNQLNKLKNHIYSLSYSTIESIILPQEKNEVFVEKFMDMTVANANKVFGWKCERKHVKPFYDEMITWCKQKRYQMKHTEAGENKKVNKVITNSSSQSNKSINKTQMSNNTINDHTVSEDITQDCSRSEDVRCSKKGTNKNSMSKNNRNDKRINEEKIIESNHTNQNRTHCSRINQTGLSESQINAQLPAANTLHDCQIDENTNTKYIKNKGIKDKRINNNTIKDIIPEAGISKTIVNDNRMLMEHLVTPPRPVNFSHSTVAPIPSLNLNAENSTCIFSYGTPEHQVTINISKDTMINHTSNQNFNPMEQNTPNVMEISGNKNMSTHLAQSYYPGKNKPLQPLQRLSPTYATQTQIASTTIPQNFTYIQNRTQPTISQNIQLDQTLRHPTPFTVMVNNDSYFGQMHNTQVQEQSTTKSLKTGHNIRNTSINHSSGLMATGRCNTCGKITTTKCSKCHKISYCSKQCKWLDTEARKTLQASCLPGPTFQPD